MNEFLSQVPLLHVQNASVYRDGNRILNNICLSVGDGENVAIVGPNGSGKSTLIKLITKQLYPFAGKDEKPLVEVFGRERWDVFELRSKLGILSNDIQQDFTSDGSLEAIDSVISGFFASKGVAAHQKVTQEMIDAAQKALALAGAAHLANRKMAQLSTGEARRVMIARTLVSDPRAVILDEPTSGLDIASRRRFLHTIRHITHHHKTVILVTHHVEEIIPEINRVILMKAGQIFRDGTKDELLTSETLSELFDENIQLRRAGGYYSAEIEPADSELR
jgi:iron complex transport system ATP-binding protein